MSYEGGRGGDKGNPIQKGHYLQKDSMDKARNYQVSENQSHQGTLCAFNLKGGLADIMLYND